MTTVDEHAAHIAELLAPALAERTELVGVEEALGRVTVAPIASPVDLPLFRNSQMDGFAVHAADVPGTLPIVGEVSARPSDPPPLEPGTAVRIMTGAVVPEGADAVVRVEDTAVSGSNVIFAKAAREGDYVRARGSDLREGDQVLPGGLRLASRHLAVLAAAGLTTVPVRARARVAIITTGSELIEPGVEPRPGEVFDSNGTALAAAVRSVGATVAFRAHVSDEPDALLDLLQDAAAAADLILTSGGISMGDYEVVRETLEPRGARVGHVAMQPGGPQATAVFDGVPVVCFPGNPVSTQLSFELFVAPLLRELAALPAAIRETRTLVGSTRSVAGKRQFLRGRAVDELGVELVSGASSHLVAGLAASDLLVIVPEDVTELAPGALVETWAL